ncbi:MAG: hypothetical protein F7B61_04115 [Caldisphaeraceae archaeon]|nr:hypothetical protein [Caldisphaeraceae archaeon]
MYSPKGKKPTETLKDLQTRNCYNPKETTNSKEHGIITKKHGLDRHTASAYIIALRGLKKP